MSSKIELIKSNNLKSHKCDGSTLSPIKTSGPYRATVNECDCILVWYTISVRTQLYKRVNVWGCGSVTFTQSGNKSYIARTIYQKDVHSRNMATFGRFETAVWPK